MAVEQLRDFLENGNIRNSVNYPDALLPRLPDTTRLGVANRNIPNMVGQISTCLAARQINIADLLNNAASEKTPLQKQLDRLTIVIASIAGLAFVLSSIHHYWLANPERHMSLVLVPVGLVSILTGIALLVVTTAIYVLGRNRIRGTSQGFSSASGQG